MALFGKKNEDEEEYEGDEAEKGSFAKRSKPKDFKDLNPKNRKKRKEPKKPWGRKERLVVLAVIVITAGISGFLSLSSRAWKLPGLPRLSINIPEITLPFIGEETIIIEGKKEDIKTSEKVISGIEDLTKDLSGVYGVYVVHLESGFSYGINEDEKFEPASLNKLPTMLGSYIEADTGNLDLETEYRLKNADKLAGSGSLYSKPSGTLLTYRELIRYMGKESDNTAYNIMRGVLGRDKIEAAIRVAGMQDTVVFGDKQQMTPKDVGTFFQKLYLGGLISTSSRDELMEFLTDTVYEDHIAAGVPDGVRIVHKYGRELHVVNDAGIVFAPDPGKLEGGLRPFVVVIMSKGIVEREADRILPQISRVIYGGEVNRN